MADLGQLKNYMDDYDITFEFGKRKFKLKPSVEQILDFKRAWDEMQKGAVTADPTKVWEITAPLLGGKFNREDYRFEGGDEDTKDHDLIPTLINEGMDFELLERLIAVVHAKYTFGDDIAEDLIKHGDVGKAFKNTRSVKNEENPTPVTPTTAGETPADDSETEKA